MKTLLSGATIVNVFTGELEKANLLIEDEKIIGVGDYTAADADVTEDVSGKYICPGFIDGHIHIESTMLTPAELAELCLPHGTTAIVADPHEIANVCGVDGIKYMLEASEGLPMTVYINLPSCVPATPFDESGAELFAEDLKPLYSHKRVLGLAEMMNYPGVIFGDKDVHKKLSDARELGKHIDGHAPFLRGRDLDKYVASGIRTDHECSNSDEAIEKIRTGQWIMIRQGTAARNLDDLLPLFDSEYSHRCIFVTDDRHPADIKSEGHIDNIVRLAVKAGKSPITAIKMATIQSAECFGLRYVGAVAPGYKADVLVLDDLDTVAVRDVYVSGKKIVDAGKIEEITHPEIDPALHDKVFNSFHVGPLVPEDFTIAAESNKCRVIKVNPGTLVTDELITHIDFGRNNGVDVDRDIVKLAVIERHKNTGHRGLGFINGIGLKKGAIASSVSHDSHNLIVMGTNEADMAIAANHICKVGGNVVVCDGEVVAEMPLHIAGLMTDLDDESIAAANKAVRMAAHTLGTNDGIEPFMNMAFVSLSVIPSLKMTTHGLIDVDKFELVSLFVTEE